MRTQVEETIEVIRPALQADGGDIILRDVDEAISDINAREYRPNLKPMTPSPLIVTHNWAGHDPLAKALFEYHAKRTTGDDRAYWLARLNDKTPKPSTTIQL